MSNDLNISFHFSEQRNCSTNYRMKHSNSMINTSMTSNRIGLVVMCGQWVSRHDFCNRHSKIVKQTKFASCKSHQQDPCKHTHAHCTVQSSNSVIVRNCVNKSKIHSSSCPVSKLNLNLVQMCRKIGISDPVIAKSAINELNDLLERPESSMMQDYEELYIENVCLQFKVSVFFSNNGITIINFIQSFTYFFSSIFVENQHLSSWSMSDASGMCEALLTNLHTFYTIRPMVRNVGATSLKTLMASIVRLLADQKSSMDGHNRYAGALNRICSSILKKSNYTHIICALLRLLTETCSSNLSAPPNFTELLLKCIWRNTKDMPEKANDINYDAILLEMYEFMVTIPQSWWQKNPQLDDSPIRTVKTMLYTFVNIKGVEILNHMTEIPTDSELCLYLRKVCVKDNYSITTHDHDPSIRIK